MNWFGFNNRSNYGAGNSVWGGNYVGGWGNSGAYSGSAASNNLGSSGFNGGGNTGWGRPDESGRYYNYPNEPQPYDNFLVRGFNPGYEQYGVLGTRLDRQERTRTIDRLGQVGFWGHGSGYPLSLYGTVNSPFYELTF